MIDHKKQMRPIISSIEFMENTSKEETFQNSILRPIIKLQHDLIISYFEYYLRQNKVEISELNGTEKSVVIQRFFNNDNRFKVEIRGLITGLLTHEEFEEYLSLSANLNRRINNMLQQRVQSCYDV